MGSLFNANTVWNSKVTVLCSQEIGLYGALGTLKVINKVKVLEKQDNQMGQAGGNQFYLGNSSVNSSVLFLFQQTNPEMSVKSKPCYFQF